MELLVYSAALLIMRFACLNRLHYWQCDAAIPLCLPGKAAFLDFGLDVGVR